MALRYGALSQRPACACRQPSQAAEVRGPARAPLNRIPAVRIFWQSFVDQATSAPYMARLAAYLNEIAAPGTSVHVEGITPADRDFGRLSEFRCAIQAVDNGLAARGFATGAAAWPGHARCRLRGLALRTGRSVRAFRPRGARHRDGLPSGGFQRRVCGRCGGKSAHAD